jgi:thermitase
LKSRLFSLSTVIIFLSISTAAKEQIVLTQNLSETLELQKYARSTNSSLIFRSHLGIGDLYLLKTNTINSKMNLYANHFLTAENDIVKIGPSLINSFISLQQVFPNQDLSTLQWGFHNTGDNTPPEEGTTTTNKGTVGYDAKVTEAWTHLGPPKKEVVVGIIDSGIDLNHEALVNQIYTNKLELHGQTGVDDDNNGFIDDINGYSFLDNSPNVKDEHGHGTHCAGVIAADPSVKNGVKGLAPGVKILPIKVFGADGKASQENLIRAIDYAVRMNVDVISASWGGNTPNDLMLKAIESAKNKNIMFVTAAGNESENNDNVPFYPANYDLPNVISVAAHQSSGKLASFSNYGPTKVFIGAPGQNIISTLPNNSYAVWSGTSMATPHVSGAIALLIQQDGALSCTDIRNKLYASSLPQMDWRKSLVSMGRLNVEGLLLNQNIDRGTPKDGLWKVYSPQSPLFETDHPITSENLNLVKDFYVPGAKFVRIVFSKIKITDNSPSLHIRDPITRTEPESLPLNSDTIIKSDYLPGERIGFRLSLQNSGSWGLIVDSIEYQ